MPRKIKILIFSCFCMVYGMAFFGKWIETGSAWQGLIFIGQLTLLFVGRICYMRHVSVYLDRLKDF
jgi:hypothetical protein